MMMGEFDIIYFLEILEVTLISAVKFVLAPFEAERYHFNFWKATFITSIGGWIGVFFFYYAGVKFLVWWQHGVALLKSFFIKKSIQSKKKKVFTRSSRFIIRIKMRFGIIGIAFITPSLISIPIGSIVAANFYKKKKGVLLYFIISVFIWSLVINGIAQLLKLSQYVTI